MEPSILFEGILADGVRLIMQIISAIVILFVAWYSGNWVSDTIYQKSEKAKIDSSVAFVLSRFTRWAIFVVGILLALAQVNFDVMTLAAGIGGLSVAFGLAMQNISQNFVSGIMLLIQQPFKVGDVVKVDDEIGIITDIQIQATTIRTFDGVLVIIPNCQVYNNIITNFSNTPKRRLRIAIGVDYNTDLDKADRILQEVAMRTPGMIPEPAPMVIFKEFGDNSINGMLYVWTSGVKESSYLQAIDATVRDIHTTFNKEGINIPFPVRTVYIN